MARSVGAWVRSRRGHRGVATGLAVLVAVSVSVSVSGIRAGVAFADEDDDLPEIAIRDVRLDALISMQVGGPNMARAARSALLGSDADVREFLDAGTALGDRVQ